MAIEYVKLEPSEQVYGKKHLLSSQIELLSIIKRYQKFKDLRKKELSLKALLRRTITELNEEIKIIDASLPKIKEQKTEEESFKMLNTAKKRKDIETEILEIKRQLEKLQA